MRFSLPADAGRAFLDRISQGVSRVGWLFKGEAERGFLSRLRERADRWKRTGAGVRIRTARHGNPRDVGRLRIYVEGATLHVEDRRRFALFQPPVQGIRYVVTVPELQAIEFSGAGRIDIDPLATSRLDIKMSGVGTIDVQDLQADGVEVDFSGGGRAILHGTVADQSVSISGAGSYEAADLRTETARVRVSGAGAAELWVTEALDIDISGLGSVRYYGDPVVSQNVSGLGSVGSLGPKE